MDFAIFRLFIRVSLFVIALIACIIYLIKKRKLIYSIFFDKEAIKKEYTGKNDIIFLRLANTILVIVAILLILYLKDFVLDMPYIINKQYSYAEGYVTEQSHGGADISSERRSIFLYDKVKDDEIEITVFSRYIDKNTYLKVQYLPHTKYGAKQPDEEWNPLFAEALHKKNYIEYLLDILLYGSLEERKALVAEQRKEVLKLEQRIAELSADRTMHSRRNPKQLRAERER